MPHPTGSWSSEDFSCKEERPEYTKKLHGKFIMRNVFLCDPPCKPDRGKAHVQDLMWEDKAAVSKAISTNKAYVYRVETGII